MSGMPWKECSAVSEREEFVMVSARVVVVGIDGNGADMPGDFAFCDPVHITRIEPIRNDRERSTRKPRNKRD